MLSERPKEQIVLLQRLYWEKSSLVLDQVDRPSRYTV